jgi:GT2 family glycosyltransferase
MSGGTNDYSEIESRLEMPADRLRAGGISMVVPTYNRAQKLANMLAATIHIRHEVEELEIVVADDGSTDDTASVVRTFETELDITHVRRPDRGHRLAEICNVGLRTAKHPRIILLQSDMMPAAGLITAYNRWLSATENVLLIGMRRFTCTDPLSADQIGRDPDFEKTLPSIRTRNEMWRAASQGVDEDWRMEIYRRTNWLRNERRPYRAVVGSNLAFHKSIAQQIGGFSEAFQAWGGEDGEFGYRAYNAGLYLVPVPEAIAYHQEPPSGMNETDRIAGFETTRAIREQLCALPPFRKTPSKLGPPFRHAKIAICVLAGSCPETAGILDRTAGSVADAEIVRLQGRRPRAEGSTPSTHAEPGATQAQANDVAHLIEAVLSTSSAPYLVLRADGRAPALTLITALAAELDQADEGAILATEHDQQILMVRARDCRRLMRKGLRLDDSSFGALLSSLAQYLGVRRHAEAQA